MKKFIISIILIISATPVALLNAQDVTYKVSAPPSVAVGTQFQVQYILDNATNGTEPRVHPEFLECFEILFGPTPRTSEDIRIFNGKQTRHCSLTHTLIVTAKKEGTFTIGPATIKVGNSEYKSNSFTIKVLPPDQAAQAQQQQGGGGNASASSGPTNENLFMLMNVSKRSVYEQEGLLVTFKLYTMFEVRGLNPKFPEFEGVWSQEVDLGQPQLQMESYNGRNILAAIIKQSVLYPQRSGQLTIGRGGKVDVIVSVPSQQRPRNIFEGFLNSYQNVSKELVASPVTIEVKPLPPGKPAGFTNAVGNYTMSSEINRKELKANEAVTIKLTIKGNGNIQLLKNPEVKFPNDFDILDPVSKNNTNVTTAGVSGTRTIEYTAIPRYAGDFEIPPVTFSYFDTQSGTYKTLSTEPFKLHVEKDESSGDGVVANFTNRENVRFLGKDIRYLKTQNIQFRPTKDIFFGSFLYVMAYLMITILFVAFFIIYRKQVKENSNIALVRTKKANKTAVKRLKQAEKLLHENKEEAFYEEVLRALWGYLSDKLNMPQSELTKDNVATELTKYGVDDALSGEFLDIIHTCEFARYAPSKASGAMDKLFGETIHAIDKMENTIKK